MDFHNRIKSDFNHTFMYVFKNNIKAEFALMFQLKA